MNETDGTNREGCERHVLAKRIRRHWQLYLVIAAPLLYIVIFKYVPMYGTIIAFKDFRIAEGIWGSAWAGLKHFQSFFLSPNFPRLMENTLTLSLYGLLVGFPAPIALALALNEAPNRPFQRFVQLTSFAPYFISTVVMVSMIVLFLSPRIGMGDKLFAFLGVGQANLLGNPDVFKHILVWSDVWQQIGYGAVIYLAALAGINPQLYEAAKVDGASRLRKIWHIDLPGIMPAIIVLLILQVGQFMKLGFEKIYLLQNQLNVGKSEIIATYVYKIGLEGSNFSFASAVGLFNSVINLILLVIVNYIARKVSETSLW